MNTPTLAVPETEQVPAVTENLDSGQESVKFEDLNTEDIADRAAALRYRATLKFEEMVANMRGYKCLTFRRLDENLGVGQYDNPNENEAAFKQFIVAEICRNLQLSQSELGKLAMVRVTHEKGAVTLDEAIDLVLEQIRKRGEYTFARQHSASQRDSRNLGWQSESITSLLEIEKLIGEAALKLLKRNSLEQENTELKVKLEEQAAGVGDLQTEVRALTERLLIISDQLAQSPIDKLTTDIVSRVNGVKNRVRALNPLKFLEKKLGEVIAQE